MQDFWNQTKDASAYSQKVWRLWYWKPANGQKYLSGVAVAGLHCDSKISVVVTRMHLTEDCEIIECSEKAEKSIRGFKIDEN